MSDKESTNSDNVLKEFIRQYRMEAADGPYTIVSDDIDVKIGSAEQGRIITQFEFWKGRVFQVENMDGKVVRISLQSVPCDVPRDTPQPPINAEFVLHLLLPKDEQDGLIGDLTERYARKCGRLGERRANTWFYFQVVCSVWPLLKRTIAKISGLMAVGEWIRRHIS